METNSLFATNIEFLNDSNEFWHTIELSFYEISKLAENSTDHFYRKVLTQKENFSNKNLFKKELISTYIVSFTKYKDSASFLERYGEFNIGIEFNENEDIEKPKHQFIATEVIYSNEEKSEKLRKLAIEIAELPLCKVKEYYWPSAPNYETIKNYSETDFRVDAYFRALQIIASWFKSESFEDEAEVRLVVYKNENTTVDFINSNNAIIPIIKIDLNSVEWKWDSILIGSSKYFGVQHKAIVKYFEKFRGYSINPKEFTVYYSDSGQRLNR